MIGIVVGASEESVFAIQVAQSMGLKVIAFDGNPEAIGLQYADVSYVVDIRKPEQIIEKLESIRPDIVLPIPIGRYLISGAHLNDYYGLSGISEKAAQLCTDKYQFHMALQEGNLRKVECVLISEGTKGGLSYDVHYPVIVKPRYGSGSRAVVECKTESELRNIFLQRAPFNEDYIMETAFSGTEYGVDGAIVNGKVTIVLVRRKLLTPPPVRQCIGYLSCVEEEGFEQKLQDYLQKVVTCMMIDKTVFHADIMYHQDTFFVIELSGRPSGHRLHNIFTPLVTGINLIAEYIKYCKGLEYEFRPQYKKCMMIRYFDFEDCEIMQLPDKHQLSEIYEIPIYECNLKVGEILGKVVDGHSIMNRGYFILKGNDEEDLYRKSEAVLDMFQLRKIDKKGESWNNE